MKFPGILPALPNANPGDTASIRTLLDEAAAQKSQFAPDTYWDGKNLGRLATLMQIARQTGTDAAAGEFHRRLRNRLETWLTATNANGQPKTQQLFYHDANWGALIGCPASYGSDVELNDHAFHYGYFVHAAAALAFHDPEWARAWGPMVELLARDMACADRRDPRFPFLRAFDPYAGHSWASGAGKFADGNNQESSSEALNAWAGLTLWGEATGNTTLRDLGAWLFTTELAAVEDYWFDVTGELRPREYTPSVVTMVWGGKSVNETWFSPKPEDVHMINWLPFTGASLYLGRHPAYVRRNYEALRREVGGEEWRGAADLILMYRALDDPEDARRQYQARATTLTTDSGNSKANVLHWIGNLQKLGQVDRSVSGDQPMVAVFLREEKRTYVAYNPQRRPRTVKFSDGMTLDCPSRSMAVRAGKSADQP
jgi:endoglucanase Acf2